MYSDTLYFKTSSENFNIADITQTFSDGTSANLKPSAYTGNHKHVDVCLYPQQDITARFQLQGLVDTEIIYSHVSCLNTYSFTITIQCRCLPSKQVFLRVDQAGLYDMVICFDFMNSLLSWLKYCWIWGSHSVSMNNTIFWTVLPYSLANVHLLFGGKVASIFRVDY